MNKIYSQLQRLVQKLLVNTELGKIHWRIGSAESTKYFVWVDASRYTIRLYEDRVELWDNYDYRKLEEIKEDRLMNSVGLLWKKALDLEVEVDKHLDNILEYLDKL